MCCGTFLLAQDHLINQGSFSDCGGSFLDSGGNSAGYQANENYTITICPQVSVGSHVQLVFSRVEIITGDSLCFYDGTSSSAPALSCIADFGYQGSFIVQATAANNTGCITVVFKSDATGQGSGWSASINCIQACQNILAELTTSDPAVSPADTGWIDACPGQRVSLTARGLYPQNGVLYQHSDLTSEFTWVFGDGSSAVGPSVSHVYDKPGGYVVQVTIKDNRGCTNTNFISQRVRVAPPPNFTITSPIPTEICAGDTVQLSITPSGNVQNFSTGAVRSDSLALPDGTGVAYETTLNFTNFSPGQVVSSIDDIESICVNMEHTWLRDLEIEIECPNGSSIILHNFGGRSGTEVFLGEPVDFDGTNPTPGQGYDYCWTMDATNGTWLEYANKNSPPTLPSGDYNPFESFADLIGCPLNGEWKIRVQDLWAIDNGYIFSWGINFDPALFPNLESFTTTIADFGWETAASTVSTNANDAVVSPPNAGSPGYTFTVTDGFGCVFDTIVNLNVLPPTHPNCRNCQENLTPAADTTICQSATVAFDVRASSNQTNTAVAFESFPKYQIGNLNHPHSDPYESAININSISPLTLTNATAQIISVCIDIETNWLSDLRVYLVSPSGRTLELTTNNGGSSDFYKNTCFTPSASVAITAGMSPFTGNYRPEGNWNALNSSPINGDWKLRVSDGSGNEFGIINSWSITFQSTNSITYSWSPSAGLSCTNCPNPTATVATPTTYTVQATDSYGCITRDTITIRLVDDAPAPQVNCEVSGLNEITYSWNDVVPGADYEVNPIINGVAQGWQGPINGLSYVVNNLNINDNVTLQVRVYIGSSGCSAEIGTSTCVYIPCLLDLESITSTPVDCYGNNNGTATIKVSGGTGNYTYLWNDPLAQISATAVFLKAGTYQVTATDDSGCIGFGEVVVAQPDSIVINPTVTDALCKGEATGLISISPTGGVAPFTYSWSNGQTARDVINLRTGNYTVTVTDKNNCKAQALISVGEPAQALSVNVSQSLQGCYGTKSNEAKAVVSGGTGSTYTYAWSNGQTAATAIGLDSITYTLTVTDANGCKTAGSIQLKDLAPIRINLITKKPTCFGGNDGAIGVNIVTGGAGNNENDYTFRWSTNQTGSSIENLTGGINYTVTVTDIQGCVGVDSRLLEQPEKVSFALTATNAKCFGGDDGAATVSNMMGQGANFTFRWDSNAKNQTSASATNLIAGSYSVTVTDEKGCSNASTITIGQATRIETEFKVADNPCFGDAKGTIAVNVKGGTPDYTFAWPGGGSTKDLKDLPSGTYELTVTDANACTHTATATVKQPAQLTAELKVKDVTCFGDRDGSISILPQGGVAPFQYSLDNKNYNSISNIIALKSGDYKVYVKDQNGCTFFERVTVADPPEFIVDAGDNNYTILLGDSITLEASSINAVGKVTYVWTAPYEGTLSCTECLVTISKPMNMINYELYGIDEKGCEATDRVTVIVQKIRAVAVPTGFTPNADGMNDLLLVHGQQGTKVKVFRIFDRWGELLYEIPDFMVNDTIGWDGTFRGEPVNAGIYLWYLEVEYIDGMTEAMKGQTTLIR